MSNTTPIATIAPTTAGQATPEDAGSPAAMTAATVSTSPAPTASAAATLGVIPSTSTAAVGALNGPPLQAAPPGANAHAASIAALIAPYERRSREYERELSVLLMDVWTSRQRLARHGYDLINRRMHGGDEVSPAVNTLLGALALAEFFRQEVLCDLVRNDRDRKDVELSELERLEREAGVGLEGRGSGL